MIEVVRRQGRGQGHAVCTRQSVQPHRAAHGRHAYLPYRRHACRLDGHARPCGRQRHPGPPTASPVSRPPTAGPTAATRCSGPTTTDTMSTSSTAWKTRIVAQAIPNSEAWTWMKANVPLFDAPDKSFEQMCTTAGGRCASTSSRRPGYAMTEFLVPRSYADKYNLISSALGHHIHESRWLRQPALFEIVRTWLRGNDGRPMKKLTAYSSWLSASLWGQIPGRRSPRQHHDAAARPSSASTACGTATAGTVAQDLTPPLYWQYDARRGGPSAADGMRRTRVPRSTAICTATPAPLPI